MPRLIPFLTFLVAWFPRAAQAELPTKPEDVLPYLEQVYKDGDIEAYANLLTSDCRFVTEGDLTGADKAADVMLVRRLFGVASVKLSFSANSTIKTGSEPGTWTIENVTSTFDVTMKKDGKPRHVENVNSFVIRYENGTMRVAEWRQGPLLE